MLISTFFSLYPYAAMALKRGAGKHSELETGWVQNITAASYNMQWWDPGQHHALQLQQSRYSQTEFLNFTVVLCVELHYFFLQVFTLLWLFLHPNLEGGNLYGQHMFDKCSRCCLFFEEHW